MHIIINHSSMIPIYEQIVEAIKEAILSNQLSPNEALPSVRALSKELKISALTVKKAYDFLEKEGYTTTVHGKGSYVLEVSQNEVKENCLKDRRTIISCYRKREKFWHYLSGNAGHVISYYGGCL